MNVLLVCAAGMSTSLVVEKMKKALQPDEAHFIINAIPSEGFEAQVDNYDVILLGPQLKFKKREFEKITQPKGKPLEVINMTDYGTVRGDKILDFARQLYQNKK